MLCNLVSRRVWRYSVIDSILTAKVFEASGCRGGIYAEGEYEDETKSWASHCGRLGRNVLYEQQIKRQRGCRRGGTNSQVDDSACRKLQANLSELVGHSDDKERQGCVGRARGHHVAPGMPTDV